MPSTYKKKNYVLHYINYVHLYVYVCERVRPNTHIVFHNTQFKRILPERC